MALLSVVNVSTVQVGVVGYLVAKFSMGAVAGIDCHVIRQLAEIAEGIDDHEHGATGEVCSAYGQAEEGIAGKERAFFLAVVAQSSHGVSWCSYRLQRMCAEVYLVVAADEATDTWRKTDGHAAQHRRLLLYVAQDALVAAVKLYLQSEGLVQRVCSKVVVKVSVGGYKVLRTESLGGDVADDLRLLFGCECAAVDDDAFLCLVANHIAVLV